MTTHAHILTEVHKGVGFITLNRPSALNAIHMDMVEALMTTLKAWKTDPAVEVVVFQSCLEKAFCAGGDVKGLYHHIQAGEFQAAEAFYHTEYQLNHLLASYPKPTVALGNGLVMGGGLGLVMQCRYRIATPTSSWAMPEVAIGFFPDVGAAYFLNQCPGSVGHMMAVTGYRAPVADLLFAGLATHALDEESMALFIQGLKEAPMNGAQATDVIDLLLEALGVQASGMGALEAYHDKIEACFSENTMPEVLEACYAWKQQAKNPKEKEWVQGLIALMEASSPLSMAVTLKYLKKYKTKSLQEAYQKDYDLADKFLTKGDFMEGVRAKLVDKDFAPKWRHAHVEDVSNEEIEMFMRDG